MMKLSRKKVFMKRKIVSKFMIQGAMRAREKYALFFALSLLYFFHLEQSLKRSLYIPFPKQFQKMVVEKSSRVFVKTRLSPKYVSLKKHLENLIYDFSQTNFQFSDFLYLKTT